MNNNGVYITDYSNLELGNLYYSHAENCSFIPIKLFDVLTTGTRGGFMYRYESICTVGQVTKIALIMLNSQKNYELEKL